MPLARVARLSKNPGPRAEGRGASVRAVGEQGNGDTRPDVGIACGIIARESGRPVVLSIGDRCFPVI